MQMSSPNGLFAQHSGHRSLGIGHTGNPSDHEHSVHLSQSVRPLVNSVKPYSPRASVRIRARVSFIKTRHRSDVSSSSRRDNRTHRAAIPLRHADPGEHFPPSLLRHRCVRSRSSSYDSVSPRLHSRFPSRSRGKKKKSHKKRKYSPTSSHSSHRSSFSSFRERERKWYKSKEETH